MCLALCALRSALCALRSALCALSSALNLKIALRSSGDLPGHRSNPPAAVGNLGLGTRLILSRANEIVESEKHVGVCVCVCVCACACVYVCVYVCVFVPDCACKGVDSYL